MRKAKIILLVLGIVVIIFAVRAVIGYLLYTNFISSNSEINQQKCNSETVTLCTGWESSGTPPSQSVFPPDYLTVCGLSQVPTQSDMSDRCAAVGISGLPKQ